MKENSATQSRKPTLILAVVSIKNMGEIEILLLGC
jgi:hypothetical protein